MTGPGRRILWFLLVGLISLSGCAATQIVETWKDPALGTLKFQKTAVLFMDPSQTRRRTGEDELVRRLPAGSAVPGYLLFPQSEPVDFNQTAGLLRERGFDGAVVVRVLEAEERLNWVPGHPALAPPYRGYYFRRPFWYDAGYYRTDQIVRVETSVYSLEMNKLAWSGITESFNPTSPAALMTEVAATVIEELRRQGWFLF